MPQHDLGPQKQCFRSVLGSSTYKIFAYGAVLKVLNSLIHTDKVFRQHRISNSAGFRDPSFRLFARRELLYLTLELGPAFGVKIELLRPIIVIMLLSVPVFFCPIHTTVTFVDVLTIVNDLFQARNSYSLSFLPMEANHIGGDNRLRLLTAHKCSVSKNE